MKGQIGYMQAIELTGECWMSGMGQAMTSMWISNRYQIDDFQVRWIENHWTILQHKFNHWERSNLNA